MRLINRLFLYASSAFVIGLTFYLNQVPVAAKEYLQGSLPLAEERVIPPKQYLYLKTEYARVLDRLINCESGWKPAARSKLSTASGLGQFINGTWTGTRLRMGRDASLALKLDPYENIDTLIFLWDGGRGAGHWRESQGCWK